MKRVLTFGEVLLRLSTKNKIERSQHFEANYGGSEANVAVALSNYGIDTAFVTKLPQNELGDTALQRLREFGVNVKNCIRGGERIGLYFLEEGYSVRPSKVIYDRKSSSISQVIIEEFDLDELFKDQNLFHISGITLAISEESFQLAKSLMKAAKERGLKVSFDFNYRSKLWEINQAKKKIEQVLNYVDIIFAGHLDFTNILGIEPDKPLEVTDILSYYQDLYSKVLDKYNVEYIVSSIREVESASKNCYQGILYDGNKIYTSQKYSIDIVDRVGTGDAFTGGFLYSYLMQKDNEYKIEFATASSAIKHTIAGDMIIAKVDEVENLFKVGSFKVQR